MHTFRSLSLFLVVAVLVVSTLLTAADGQTLASGHKGNQIKIWSVPDGRLLARLTEHTGSVRTLAISEDGKTLVSGALDGTLRSGASGIDAD